MVEIFKVAAQKNQEIFLARPNFPGSQKTAAKQLLKLNQSCDQLMANPQGETRQQILSEILKLWMSPQTLIGQTSEGLR